ncbi:MAG: SDR family NAD(P)-dependent oxidoreductase [Actinomycetota bacterium]|nr:SDR family NAD(P)-dependent oxidoreductase [Actinomycetota bacterium]
MVDVNGRVAVITGASRGLGAGLARHFAGRGMRLGLCARSDPVLPGSDDVVATSVDVAEAGALDAFAAEVAGRFGAIDLWVNNAAVLEPIGPLRDTEAGDIAAHLAVNVMGVVHGTQAYIRHLRALGGEGVLANLSSGAADHGYAGWAAYCASKAAVDRLTEVTNLEEADHGLRAYAFSPGVVDTDMQHLIRRCPPERFPAVGRFLELARTQAFNSPAHVATHLLAVAFDPAQRPGGYKVRVPNEAR